jgi:hypothetical protein
MVPGREMAERTGWGREFDEPITSPGGQKLVTLRDAASFITSLPEDESALPDWQAAIAALILVADLGGPTMFARIGVTRALNRHHVRQSNPNRKDPHWGRRKLKRTNYCFRKMHSLRGLRLGLRKPSGPAMGWQARLQLRRRWRAMPAMQSKR